MIARLKIHNIGPKRVFTVPLKDFTPGHKPGHGPKAATTIIDVGKSLDATINNGEAICVVELEN
jgi:hypothetical protein